MDNAGGDNNGTAANPKAIIGYPGETATIGAYSTSSGQPYGMRTPNIAFNADYWVFAELTLRGGTQASDIGAHGWRVVGMDVSACCNTSQVGAFQFNAGDHTAGQPMQYILGNEIHDSGPSPAADKFYHALYLSTDSNYFDVGWNHIHNNLHLSRDSGTQFAGLLAGLRCRYRYDWVLPVRPAFPSQQDPRR
jgi:hypothetical protein